MKLSIIVIFHNMRREAARTLYSLSTRYQTGIGSDDYEVVAIDNGSTQPLDEDLVGEIGPNFTYRFFETASVSPVEAVNAGAAIATGDLIAVIVDGARMATPGLLENSLKAARLFEEPFVCSLSWHLGPDVQNISVFDGYDQAEEDRLLASIDWKKEGYRLFEVSTIAPSSRPGMLAGVPVECSWFVMPRRTFLRMGGFEPKFRRPGGGRMNHEFRNRALAQPGLQPVVLLGEGVFHQVHGGVTTNVAMKDHPAELNAAEYREIRGRDWSADVPGARAPYFFGHLPDAARRFLLDSEP